MKKTKNQLDQENMDRIVADARREPPAAGTGVSGSGPQDFSLGLWAVRT